jgi:hypothetical protein
MLATTTRPFAGMIVVALAITIAARPASASCPVDPSIGADRGALSGIDPSTRLSFIADRMDFAAPRALAWSLGWTLAFGAASVTQIAVTPAVSEGTRVPLYVGSAAAAVGTLTRIINRPRVIRERRQLRRFLRSGPDECTALREAERALARSARWEQRSTTLLLHFGALAWSVSTGLLLALAFDRPIAGHRQLAIGATVGQLMLVSTPTITLDALGSYRRGAVGRLSSLQTFPMLLPGGAGIGVGGSM